jgi:hypothetical protein
LATVVSVQCQPCPGRTPEVRHLSALQAITFGSCSCNGCGYDLLLAPTAAGHVAGRIIAHADHWRLDNLTATNRLFVENVEEPGELVTIPPRRAGVVVPFEIARVMAGETRQITTVTVFGPEPVTGCPTMPSCPRVTESSSADRLDESTTYFDVLIALCEQRLCGEITAALPTSAAIAGAMRERGRSITPRAVDEQIEYLIGKLGLRPENTGPARRSWRKEVLANAALRRGLVRREHIAKDRTAGTNRARRRKKDRQAERQK